MATTHLIPPFERLLNRIVETMTPDEILSFQISEEEQQRAQELLDLNHEGLLTEAEKDELEQMSRFNRLMSILKIKAFAARREL